MTNKLQKLTDSNFIKFALIILLVGASFFPLTIFYTWVIVMFLTVFFALKLSDKITKWFFIVSYLLCELMIWISGIIEMIKGNLELEGMVFYLLAFVNLVILELVKLFTVTETSERTKNFFFISLSTLLAFIVIFLILQSILL